MASRRGRWRMPLLHGREYFLGKRVVEGFYGRPWTAAQRRKLFAWMKAWGLNTYLYAPKDDLKHRLFWRELYSATEAAELKDMISECRRKGL